MYDKSLNITINQIQTTSLVYMELSTINSFSCIPYITIPLGTCIEGLQSR